jgi:hypothetical protein
MTFGGLRAAMDDAVVNLRDLSEAGELSSQ